jgi:hypothetical protein
VLYGWCGNIQRTFDLVLPAGFGNGYQRLFGGFGPQKAKGLTGRGTPMCLVCNCGGIYAYGIVL